MAARAAARATRNRAEPPPGWRPGGQAHDRRRRHGGARARPAHARLPLQHAARRQGRPKTACAATRRWLAARNLSNEASDESVQALIEAVRGRYEIPRRWYRLKARLLGLDRIADYDRLRVGERGRGRPLHLRRGARDRARVLLGLLARAGGARQALLRRASDRRARAPRQARRRVLRGHRPLGVPLRAAQLHRSPPRRADARARAGARRPLRAGRPAGDLPPVARR